MRDRALHRVSCIGSSYRPLVCPDRPPSAVVENGEAPLEQFGSCRQGALSYLCRGRRRPRTPNGWPPFTHSVPVGPERRGRREVDRSHVHQAPRGGRSHPRSARARALVRDRLVESAALRAPEHGRFPSRRFDSLVEGSEADALAEHVPALAANEIGALLISAENRADAGHADDSSTLRGFGFLDDVQAYTCHGAEPSQGPPGAPVVPAQRR